MKLILMFFCLLVLVSLGFTVTDMTGADQAEEKKLMEEFKASTSTGSLYHQSRKDIATFD